MKYNTQIKNAASAFFMAAMFVGALAMPGIAFAEDEPDAVGKVSAFLTNINSILNVASVVVVTIAVVFAGYQIAFAHKRISDVAPVLIGGFLIGAASQLAKMVIPGPVGSDPTSMLSMLPMFYA